jgi:hypothetical protein
MVVINNTTPATTADNGNGGMGFLLGLLLLLVFAFLIFWYGLPLLRSAMSGPQINVPNKVDINVHQTK